MLLRDTIYIAIRRAIITCELQPGQDLREQALAEQYGVSRSPIRDALLRLAQENLVTVLPREGYQVKPILISDAANICDFRLLIEPACARAAAQADGKALRVLDRFRGFADLDHTENEHIEYNHAFHCAIAEAAGNKLLETVARNLTGQIERLLRVRLRVLSPDAVGRICLEHEAIIDALQAHDAGRASRLTYEHVKASNASILTMLRHREPVVKMSEVAIPVA